jgi:hypothetical protein
MIPNLTGSTGGVCRTRRAFGASVYGPHAGSKWMASVGLNSMGEGAPGQAQGGGPLWLLAIFAGEFGELFAGMQHSNRHYNRSSTEVTGLSSDGEFWMSFLLAAQQIHESGFL